VQLKAPARGRGAEAPELIRARHRASLGRPAVFIGQTELVIDSGKNGTVDYTARPVVTGVVSATASGADAGRVTSFQRIRSPSQQGHFLTR